MAIRDHFYAGLKNFAKLQVAEDAHTERHCGVFYLVITKVTYIRRFSFHYVRYVIKFLNLISSLNSLYRGIFSEHAIFMTKKLDRTERMFFPRLHTLSIIKCQLKPRSLPKFDFALLASTICSIKAPRESSLAAIAFTRGSKDNDTA